MARVVIARSAGGTWLAYTEPQAIGEKTEVLVANATKAEMRAAVRTYLGAPEKQKPGPKPPVVVTGG